MQDDLYCDPSCSPHAGLKSATTAAGSLRALPLLCGLERIIISVYKTRQDPLISQANLRFRWPYKTLKICDWQALHKIFLTCAECINFNTAS